MAWMGIPFHCVNNSILESGVLSISKLPTIIVESSFGWDSVLGALIAGSIPAWIAWRAIKHSQNSIKYQIEIGNFNLWAHELRDAISNLVSRIMNISNIVQEIDDCPDDVDGNCRIAELRKILFDIGRDLTYQSSKLSLLILQEFPETDDDYLKIKSMIEEVRAGTKEGNINALFGEQLRARCDEILASAGSLIAKKSPTA
ncbi:MULTISPECIES: hypothetical protein [Enterobacter]|uniref:hypothetical protein n=1 Tax=Enterobacter TaxID=547 RepID=UPI0018C211DE|nr:MULTISPECIES: hypothetical protein [Enterobacter]MBG0624974.1 hypothetical protein [Enterobacter roggenkampii]MBT2048451.1 hypothetical protein [Enterobacter asburiae]MCU6407451.1 hypothetical protein [Enterobacter quasiroggenkampii]